MRDDSGGVRVSWPESEWRGDGKRGSKVFPWLGDGHQFSRAQGGRVLEALGTSLQVRVSATAVLAWEGRNVVVQRGLLTG